MLKAPSWTKRAAVLVGLYLLSASLFSYAARAAEDFLTAAPDIPLAPGLVESESGALIFDKPGGRIITIEALSAAPSAQIFAFYRASLPNLGWQRKAANPDAANPDASNPDTVNTDIYLRDSEQLQVKIEGGVVFFRLMPYQAR
jgi:hypothetical protein